VLYEYFSTLSANLCASYEAPFVRSLYVLMQLAHLLITLRSVTMHGQIQTCKQRSRDLRARDNQTCMADERSSLPKSNEGHEGQRQRHGDIYCHRLSSYSCPCRKPNRTNLMPTQVPTTNGIEKLRIARVLPNDQRLLTSAGSYIWGGG
jgi:hypothetical protein